MNATQKIEIFLQGLVDQSQQKNATFVLEFRNNPMEALRYISGIFQQVSITDVAQKMLCHMNDGSTPADVVDILVKDLNYYRNEKITGSLGDDQITQSKVDAIAEILNTTIDCATQYKNETSIGDTDTSSVEERKKA